MRVRSKSRFSPRTSKRKNEANSSSRETSEPHPKRTSRRNEGERKEPSSSKTRGPTVSSSIMVDKYCWLCHTETDEKICVTCHRAFHDSCLDKISASFSELEVCPECQSKSVDGSELSPSKFFNLDKLKKLLDVLTRRCFDKKRKKNELFLRWPEEDRDKLFKIIDFEILLDNINHVLPYTKTAEFYGDIKFIHHNSCVAYGANSDQAKAAKNLIKDFKDELSCLEACPECYYYTHCNESDSHVPFIRLCDPPHDIVWAKLTGHPYWPAKCLKVVKGMARVRFFGDNNEQSNIPINNCYYLSESHPKIKNSNLRNPKNSGPKSQHFRDELLRYIHIYERKYGAFPFYEHKTPYKPQEKQNEVIIISAEGSSTRNMAQMKLEGIVNEDSEANVINAATVMEFSEENLTFPSSLPNDIRSPNGQYSTSAELLSSLNVDDSFLTTAPVEGGPSPVRSINMSFSSEENPSNIESVLKNPVVTSTESLQHIESPPVTLLSAGDTLDCEFRLMENFKGILHSEASKVAESIQCTEIVSETVANNTSDEFTIQQSSLPNNMNNLVSTSNQSESDNDVQCLGQKINIEADETFNPNIILPFLEASSPELKAVIQKARYWIDGILIHLWASCNKNSDTLGRISKMSVDLRKCRSALKKMEEENVKVKKEEAENKYKMQSLTDQVKELESEKKNLQNQVQLEIARKIEATENAKLVIQSLRTGCSKKIEETLRKQFIDTITEKEKNLQDAERRIKSLEEEKRQMEKELEEAKIAKESVEETLRITKSQEPVYDRDDIDKFKKTHYCSVCTASASFTCCLNTSYCSQDCQEYDAKEHEPHCGRRKNSSQVVQQIVYQKTVSLSCAEMSTINNSSNSQISASNSIASSTHHKDSESSGSSMQPIPISVKASSSHSSTSKSKRRSHK